MDKAKVGDVSSGYPPETPMRRVICIWQKFLYKKKKQ